MKATDRIKEVFENHDTNVLNIADYGFDDGYVDITHVVLDGDNLILYSANPDLLDDFQDDDYEPACVEDDDDLWMEIKSTIVSL